MLSLQVYKLEKSYADRFLFKDLSFNLIPGDKLALIGSNGSGKTTLLDIILGLRSPDQGQVFFNPPEAGIGYAAQEIDNEDLNMKLLDWSLSGLPCWSGFWSKWQEAVQRQDQARMRSLSQEQVKLETQLGYNPEHLAQSVLNGLGFSQEQICSELFRLSGGWQERAKLGRALVQGQDMLLLDEPTNHLDLQTVQWLEEFLLDYRGVLVFAAHDRIFLDRLANKVLFLSRDSQIIRNGNFSDFLRWQEEVEETKQRQAQKISRQINHLQSYVDRFRYKADKARQAQSRLKSISKLKQEQKRLASANTESSLFFNWPSPPRSGYTVLSSVDLEFSYPETEVLWKKMSFNLYRGQKIGLVGGNGAGKSTLLKLIAGEIRPNSGYVKLGSGVRLGYFCQSLTEAIEQENSVLAEIKRLSHPGVKEEELRSVLGLFQLGQDFWDLKVGRLSGGEKNRLFMASLFLRKANLLILDEPTNHLDLSAREGLARALNNFSGTVFMVAHDRYILQEVAEEIWVLEKSGLQFLNQGFEEYEQRLEQEQKKHKAKEVINGGKKNQSKEQKRREAEQRNALHRELKPLRQSYAECEQELEETLQRQDNLENLMMDPTTYGQGELVEEYSKEYQWVLDKGNELFKTLEELEKKIIQIKEQYKAI